MMPHFASGQQAAVIQTPKPAKLRLIEGPVKRAVLTDGWKRTAAGMTPAQKAGARYEKRVHVALKERYGYMYHEGQPILFEDAAGEGTAIPDGIIKTLGCLTILEVKSQHMPESWWQLRKKYEPLVRRIFPKQRVLLLEICKSLDASMPYPEEYEVISSIDSFIVNSKDGSIGVLQWKL